MLGNKNKKIFMTENSYAMSNNDGSKTLITKEDLKKVTCLRREKSKLEKKVEEREEYLMRILKNELNEEKKIQKIKDKINKKEKKINKFLEKKYDTIKIIENERFQDKQNIYERQRLLEKMLSNFEQKICMTKKQQQEQTNNINNEKMEELKEQIKDYERKNNEYKKKISDLFDLKEKRENEEKKIKGKKFDLNNPDIGARKLLDMEEKFELERFRRENALMTNINKFQDKINNILEKKEEKEKKIKKSIQETEKKREEKRIIHSMHYEEVRNKIKNNQKKLENERNLKLQSLEKKDLKDFAIKQEKIKMQEERKKLNQLSYDNKEAMKAKLKEMLKEQNNFENIENVDNIINKILYN